jgi:hypothetical protein
MRRVAAVVDHAHHDRRGTDRPPGHPCADHARVRRLQAACGGAPIGQGSAHRWWWLGASHLSGRRHVGLGDGDDGGGLQRRGGPHGIGRARPDPDDERVLRASLDRVQREPVEQGRPRRHVGARPEPDVDLAGGHEGDAVVRGMEDVAAGRDGTIPPQQVEARIRLRVRPGAEVDQVEPAEDLPRGGRPPRRRGQRGECASQRAVPAGADPHRREPPALGQRQEPAAVSQRDLLHHRAPLPRIMRRRAVSTARRTPWAAPPAPRRGRARRAPPPSRRSRGAAAR